MTITSDEMFPDPEVPDESDPEVKEDMFVLQKGLGLKPEDLTGATQRKREEYAAWLDKHK